MHVRLNSPFAYLLCAFFLIEIHLSPVTKQETFERRRKKKMLCEGYLINVCIMCANCPRQHKDKGNQNNVDEEKEIAQEYDHTGVLFIFAILSIS